jgi:DNA-binding phage protein
MTTLSIRLTQPDAAKDLVAQILALARQRGLDQTAVAKRAGISPESLSRLKKSGKCRLATALDLARAAGLKHLGLRPDVRVSASIAARKLSAGRRIPITAEALVRSLETGVLKPEQRVHLLGFFEELPIESVHDLVLDEGLDFERLTALAHELGAEGETVEWLGEMARYSVA